MIKIIIYSLILLGFHNANTYYKLCKNTKPIVIVKPPIINYENNIKNNKQLQKSEFKKHILKFKRRLSVNIDKINLNFFYNNLNSIKVYKKNFFSKKIAGVYDPIKNTIQILKKEPTLAINHELLHMSSSYYDKKRKIIFAGFEQYKTKNKRLIGKGLNEGYTELLDARYFNTNRRSSFRYTMCERYAMFIELIVGKDIMEKAYFNANLPLLILELEKYDTRENIIKVIETIDYFFNFYNLEKSYTLISPIKRIAKEIVKEADDYIMNAINKWSNRKTEILYNNISYKKRIQ